MRNSFSDEPLCQEDYPQPFEHKGLITKIYVFGIRAIYYNNLTEVTMCSCRKASEPTFHGQRVKGNWLQLVSDRMLIQMSAVFNVRAAKPFAVQDRNFSIRISFSQVLRVDQYVSSDIRGFISLNFFDQWIGDL